MSYNFIKVALFRRLDQLFSPESGFVDRRDCDPENIVRQAIRSTDERKRIKTIGELISRVKLSDQRSKLAGSRPVKKRQPQRPSSR
jgi:hypothetical protein